MDKHTEQVRDARGLSRLTGLSLDLKLGMRILMKSPGMTVASTLAIAVAVAIAASAFEFVTDVVNPRIPVSESERLVQLRLIDARNTQASRDGTNWYEIVGTVNGDAAVGPGSTVAVYEPLRPGRSQYVQVYMRTTEPPHTLVSRVQDIAASLDQELVMTDVKPLDAVWRPLERSSAFFESVIMLMAMIVLLFALAGIYALMSFVVAQRSREIGIRAALGANPRRIIVSIFSRAFMQVSFGILLGGVLISAAVYNSADGIRLVAGVAGAMLLMGMLGCMIPAFRALRIQPTEALRAE